MVNSTRLLQTTQSVCPECLRVIHADVVERDGKVFLDKSCQEHGLTSVYLWPNVEHYQWFQTFQQPSINPTIQTPTNQGCPVDCGICPAHKKHPTLAEIEVTLNCNQSCPVCFMAAENSNEDPSLFTIGEMLESIRKNSGIQTAIQITGGEPTIRKDLPKIISLAYNYGFTGIEINTNGLVIGRNPDYLHQLVKAGLSGVYLQFDGLNDEVYRKIRGRNGLVEKLEAIKACRREGIQVVLSVTLIEGINVDQIGPILNFALENLDVVVGVAFQPAFTSGRFDVTSTRRLGMGDVIFELANQSNGLITPTDLWPLGCSHPLCSCSTLLYPDKQNTYTPITRRITPSEYIQRSNPYSPQGSVFADILAEMELEGSTNSNGRGLSIVIMNYMDALTMDLARLAECSMTVAMPDGRLIPFCAYQLTDQDGRRLYPTYGIIPSEIYDADKK